MSNLYVPLTEAELAASMAKWAEVTAASVAKGVPALVVGQKVNVLHGGGKHQSDLSCGDTTVTRIKSNGGVVLANKYEFHADGRGLAKNNACRIGYAIYPWNDVTLDRETRANHYAAMRADKGGDYAAAHAEFMSWRI